MAANSDPAGDRVTLRALVRGAIAGAGTTPRLAKGLWSLATLRPTSKKSIGLLLQQQAAKTPEAVALVFEGQAWTYAELNAWANRFAQVLQQRGIGAGDTVGILVENRPLVLPQRWVPSSSARWPQCSIISSAVKCWRTH